jgi:hypothetical protein
VIPKRGDRRKVGTSMRLATAPTQKAEAVSSQAAHPKRKRISQLPRVDRQVDGK